MRCLVVVLMILLLPLRGWAGDAMATQMATHVTSPAVGIEAGAARTHDMGASSDCAGHQASKQADSSDAKSANGETCQACQACHTVALSSSTAIDSVLFQAPSPPLVTAAQFTSADTALGQKPPIV